MYFSLGGKKFAEIDQKLFINWWQFMCLIAPCLLFLKYSAREACVTCILDECICHILGDEAD